MTKARSQQIDLQATPYYHCISRCVRRAFLCGDDHYTQQNFDHRKQWLIDRMYFLADIFAIDIAAFSIMSNHYHLVLHVNSEQSAQLTDDEVIERWFMLYKGPVLVRKYHSGFEMTEAEKNKAREVVSIWRERLSNISWFMRCLNEYIAREANKEDNCTGSFWEGRFKSQALLDETALLSCMAYVDLNPIRAAMADDLESSDFTSIKERIADVKQAANETTHQQGLPIKPRLLPFIEAEHQDRCFAALPFNLQDYIDLVDWTGRIIRDDKRGYIPKHIPEILEKINLTDEQWQVLSLDIQQQSITLLHGVNATPNPQINADFQVK
jgi:REP element-mobilizing transposase RayT